MQRQPDIVRSLRNLRLNTDGTSQQNRMSLKPWNPIKSLIQFGFLLIFFCGPLETFGSTPVIPPSVQAAIRTRVDYGYNPGIIVGVVTESGRAYYSYGMISYESGFWDMLWLSGSGCLTKRRCATGSSRHWA